MVLPFITAISRDVFDAVPPVLKEAAYGLGCTTWEVFRHVILPYTRVGVIGGVMLGLGRALGETMAVTFVIGNAHKVVRLDPGARHHHLGLDRQRIHRGGRRPLHLVADRARPDPVRHHLHRAGLRALHAAAPAAAAGIAPWPDLANNPLLPAAAGATPSPRAWRCAATAFGLGWLVLILGVLLFEGIGGLSLAGLHREHAAAGLGGRPAQRHRRQHHDDDPGGPDRHADRHPGRHLPRRIRPPRQALERRALHQRHPAERAVDRDRPVHLRDHGGADGPLLGLGRRGGAGRHRDPGRRAHHRGHADAWCPTRCARPRPRSACRAPT